MVRLAACLLLACIAVGCAGGAQPDAEAPIRLPPGITPLTVEQDREIAG